MSVPTSEVAAALDSIHAAFPDPMPVSCIDAAVRLRLIRTRLCGSKTIGAPVPAEHESALSRAALNAEIAGVLDAMIQTARDMGEERTAIFIDGHAMAYRGLPVRPNDSGGTES